ncbi:MAG: iron-containing redox enzyme family protein [Alphaproteobacteria bacterium]|nr:iron-containing redox enzyme family protein [Alphaproteobacteria bacterium]
MNEMMSSSLLYSQHLKYIFQKRLEKILVHRVFSHPFFSYLRDLSKRGMTAKQFYIYRDNYLFRTFNTIPSLSYVLIKAAHHCDFRTLASVGRNLYEETGGGISKESHSFLLDHSHNTHGEIVFCLESLPLKNIHQSSVILDETYYFVEEQQKLYTSSHYGEVLGAMFGQEMAADSMLRVFYQTLFLPYKRYYSDGKFEDVQEYFLCHLNGVEARHGQDAREAAFRFCQNEQDVEIVLKATNAFLDIQASLWDGLLMTFFESANDGVFVPVMFTNETLHNVSSISYPKLG